LTSLLAAWATLTESGSPASGDAYADALVRACDGLSHEQLRRLPATPEEAAATIAELPFASRFDGMYLPWAWFEPFCTGLRLPIAELPNGWDVGDGQDTYWCPRATLADDPAQPEETRAFVRVDQVTRWLAPVAGHP